MIRSMRSSSGDSITMSIMVGSSRPLIWSGTPAIMSGVVGCSLAGLRSGALRRAVRGSAVHLDDHLPARVPGLDLVEGRHGVVKGKFRGHVDRKVTLGGELPEIGELGRIRMHEQIPATQLLQPEYVRGPDELAPLLEQGG